MMKVSRSWDDILPFSMFMAFFWIAVGQSVGTLAERFILSSGAAWIGTDAAETSTTYACFIGVWIVMILVILIPRRNRPMIRTIGTGMRGNTIGMLLLGFALGFLLNGVCVLMSLISKDISLYFDRFSIAPVLFLFVLVFIQSSAEELVCRGYLYQRLCRRYHPVIAILGNSALFALLHMFNPGVTIQSLLDIFVTGILFSLFVYYFDSLWCAMALHAMWNFTQNIIFGLPNSGIVTPFSIFKLDAASARDGLFYTVNFGVEGSWGSVAILAVLCVILIIIGTVRHLRPTPLWEIVPAEETGETGRKHGCLFALLVIGIIAALAAVGITVGGRYVYDRLEEGTITFEDLGIKDGDAFLESLGIENGRELFPPEVFGEPAETETIKNE